MNCADAGGSRRLPGCGHASLQNPHHHRGVLHRGWGASGRRGGDHQGPDRTRRHLASGARQRRVGAPTEPTGTSCVAWTPLLKSRLPLAGGTEWRPTTTTGALPRGGTIAGETSRSLKMKEFARKWTTQFVIVMLGRVGKPPASRST